MQANAQDSSQIHTFRGKTTAIALLPVTWTVSDAVALPCEVDTPNLGRSPGDRGFSVTVSCGGNVLLAQHCVGASVSMRVGECTRTAFESFRARGPPPWGTRFAYVP